jgi:hypothetical protein
VITGGPAVDASVKFAPQMLPELAPKSNEIDVLKFLLAGG